jgi:hypothetical protein
MSELKPREVIVLTVDKEYYIKHLDVFKAPNTNIKSVFVEGEDHKDDPKHKALLKKYLKVKEELRNYEFNKRHNQH